MSSIDDRIVKMHWDASDFDNGCKNTMAVLMQMQQQLNNLAGNTADLNVSGLNAAAEAVAGKFTWLGKVIDDVMEDVARKVADIGEKIVKALSLDPIIDGYNEYQTLLDSMRVIDANLNMGRNLVINEDWENSAGYQQIMEDGYGSLMGTFADFQKREEVSMETIEDYLNMLNTYADKTKYNFMDMTSAFSKFVKAGVKDIDTIYNAIVGYSNLSAISGATREETGRGFYNAGQVLSTGMLTRMDYNQFMNTEGLGKIFNDALVQAATDLGVFDVEYGPQIVDGWAEAWEKSTLYKQISAQMKKQAKEAAGDDIHKLSDLLEIQIMPDPDWVKQHYGDDVWYDQSTGELMHNTLSEVKTFSDNTGKTITAEELLKKISESNGNLREVLKYNWVNSEVFLKALTMFSDMDGEYSELAKEAFKAATEIRSAKELWDVITEGLGSSWVQTWKSIIGANPDEATELWTSIYKVIDDVVTKSAEARNTMMEWWHDYGGRKSVIKGFANVFKNLSSYISPLKEHWDSKSAWAQLTAEERGDRLVKMSKQFLIWSHNLKTIEWRLHAMKNVLDLLHLPLDYISSFFEHGGGKAILGILSKALEIGLKVASLEAKAITRLFADNDPGELLANYMGVFEQFFDYVANRLKEGKDGFNKILFDFFQAAMRPIKWILDSIQRVDLDDVLNILIDAFDTAVVFMETITAGFNQAFDNINVDMLAEFVDWLAQAVHRWREFFDSAEGMELLTAAADTFFSFFRMGLDFIIAKWRLLIDIIDQIAEAAQPFITKYITPVLHFLGPIFRYAGKIVLAFEKWVRESGIVYRIATALFDGLGKGIDKVIDGLNKVLAVFGVQIPKLDGSFDPNAIFGDPDKWIPELMDKIVAGFERIGGKLKDIPKLISGEINWEDFVRSIVPPDAEGKDGILTSFLIGDFDKAKQQLSESENVFAKFVSAAINGFTNLKEIFSSLFAGDFDVVREKLGDTGGWLSNLGISAAEKISNVLTGLVDVFNGNRSLSDVLFGDDVTLIDALREKLASIQEWFVSKGTENGFLAHVVSIFQTIVDKATELSGPDGNGGVLDLIKGAFGALGDYLISLGGSIVSGFFGTIASGAKNLVHSFIGENGIFGGLFKSIFGDGGEQDSEAAVEKVGLIDKLKTNITSFLEGISEFLVGDGYTAKLLDKAGNFWLLGNITSFLKDFGNGTKSFGKVLKTTVSPLKELRKSMRRISKGYKAVLKAQAHKMNAEALETGAKGIALLAGSILMIAGAILLLSNVPEDKLVLCTTLVVVIAGALAGLALAFIKLKGGVEGIAKQNLDKSLKKPLDRISKGVKSFLSKAGLALMLIGFAIALGAVVKAVVELGSMPFSNLAAGLMAAAICISLLGGVMIAITNLAKTDVIGGLGNLLTMIGISIAVGTLANAVVKLSEVDAKKISNATLALSMLMGFFTLMEVGTSFTKGTDVFPILALAAVVGVLSFCVTKLSELDPEKLKPATLCLDSLMGFFSLMEFASGFTSAKSLPGVLGMGLIVAEFAGILWLLQDLPANKTLKIATSLSEIILAVSGAFGIVAGVGQLTDAGSVSEGIGMLDLFIGDLFILFEAIGGLMTWIDDNFNGLGTKALEKARDTMETIGETLGGFVGKIFSTIAEYTIEGVGDGIASFGSSLSDFYTNATPFLEGMASVNEGTFTGIKSLAEAILALTASDLLDSINIFSNGDNPYIKFADGLNDISQPIADFASKIDGVGADKVEAAGNAAKILAEFAQNLPETGGIAQEWFGEKNLSTFATGLGDFVEPFGNFLTKINGTEFEKKNIKKAMDVANSITKWANTIPNTGGVLADFLGDNDLSGFGRQLEDFTDPFIEYLTKISSTSFDEEVVKKSNAVIKSIIAWARNVPNSGGITTWFTGDNKISDFAKQLDDAGLYFVGYSYKMANFKSGIVTKTSEAVESIMAFANAVPKNTEGSLMGLLLGNNSIDDFGYDLNQFGYWLMRYSDSMTKVDVEALDKSTPAIEKLVTMSDTLPNLGGVLSWFTGDQSYALLGDELATFGNKLKEYSDSIKGVDAEHMKSVSEALTEVVTMLNSAQGAADNVTNSTATVDGAAYFVENVVSSITKELGNEQTTGKSLEDAGSDATMFIINGLNAGYYQNADTFTGKGDTIAGDFIGTFTKAIDSDKTMVGSLTGAIDTVMTEAYKRIDREYENYKDLGSHLISGVIIGVNKKEIDLYTVMHNVAVNAYNEAANAVQVKSPSRLFMKLGEYIDLGWIAGVEHYQDDVESALVDTFRTPLNTLDALMTGAIDFQPVISPILDLSSVRAGAGQLSGFFSDRTIRLAEINDQIQNQQKAYKAQIEDARIYDDRRVVTAIGDLNSGIRAIPDAISKMGVSIDGRSLVGSITPDMNKSLGQSKIMAKRGRL